MIFLSRKIRGSYHGDVRLAEEESVKSRCNRGKAETGGMSLEWEILTLYLSSPVRFTIYSRTFQKFYARRLSLVYTIVRKFANTLVSSLTRLDSSSVKSTGIHAVFFTLLIENFTVSFNLHDIARDSWQRNRVKRKHDR